MVRQRGEIGITNTCFNIVPYNITCIHVLPTVVYCLQFGDMRSSGF